MNTMDTVRTIRLYGKLGTRFGRVHRLAVGSTAEAVRALGVLLPGFTHELMTSRERGISYACFLGKTNIGKDQLQLSGGAEDIRIAPVMAGAKQGVLQTILGAVLIVVGVVVTGLSYGWAAPVGGAIGKMGVAMMLGGVIQMLSPQQQQQSAKDSPENGTSYNFNGPVNTTAQGNPVPVLYGRMIVGSAVISAGIMAQDQAYYGAPTPRGSIPHALDLL
jgi:predicted phage tail protein